eukprot:gnl/TRDRNA2_/TRDRNA2_186399_c0_seq1.p1 gnl/TRDRNA2_/TRDRNA2_186399_c0~~gnl/TRDRNA2_/TRDRNA2_186399_c0_seq1.p1  ORF type:complete len:215 (+),score=43.99 gnl/TRDRNA2_/TRDRNA2_186399_c0_seq1:55-699(+)
MVTCIFVLLVLSFVDSTRASPCECKNGCTELIDTPGQCGPKAHGWPWPKEMVTKIMEQSQLVCTALKCELFCHHFPHADMVDARYKDEAQARCRNTMEGKYTKTMDFGVYRFAKTELDEEAVQLQLAAEADTIGSTFKESDIDGSGSLSQAEFINAGKELVSKSSQPEESDMSTSPWLKEILQSCNIDCSAAAMKTLSGAAFLVAALLLCSNSS